MYRSNRDAGMNYAPSGKPRPVVEAGEFVFAAMALDHGHIYGMCNGLLEAGGTLKYVWDPDPARAASFAERYPGCRVATDREVILQDAEVRLVAAVAVTSERADLGIEVLRHDKHYFTDKAPMTTLEQLDRVREALRTTPRRYMVYYSERLHVEGAVYAGQLIRDGAIGAVIQVIGLGPHRLGISMGQDRPDWFFRHEQYGGILCDIGSHQIEQYLAFAGESDATVVRSHVANFAHPEYPELEDFGEAMLVGAGGTTNYFRVDWFTPDGLSTWGDGRTTILGTEGYIEIRKYLDVAREATPDHVYLVDGAGEHHINVAGKVGFPYFGALIKDCLDGSEHAMTQEHALKAAELCLRAQAEAVRIG